MDAGCAIKGSAVTCAFHGDKSSSGSIYLSPDGRYRYKCHACDVIGDAADIVARSTGRPVVEILKAKRDAEAVPRRIHATKPPAAPNQPKPIFPTLESLVASMRNAVDVYRYVNPTTKAVDLAVIRLDPKSFPQAHPVPGGWQFGGVADPQPLLNRSGILTADTVVVCEGEKDCRALHALGVVATTAPMGADPVKTPVEDDGKPGKADWSPLAGKRVILWGDNDEPGRRHLDRIQRILGRLTPPPSLYRVRAEDLGEHKDAADLIAACASIDNAKTAVAVVLDRATAIHASSPLKERLEAAINGSLKSIGWPWASVDRMTQALIPGAVTILVGNPGATKSFMVLQAALWWQHNGVPFSLYEMEEDMAFWLGRSVAVLSQTGSLTSIEWIAANPDAARAIELECRGAMDQLATNITTAPPDGATLDKLADWVEAMAKTRRVLVVDPVTAALEGTDKMHVAAQKFMLRAKRACERHGASLILTTHGRKQDGKAKGAPDLDSIAGGAAYGRFASTVMWLEPSADDEEVEIMTPAGDIACALINRRLRILKARSGRGTGFTIGLRFNGGTLNANEVGVIVSKKAAEKIEKRRPSKRMFSEPSKSEDVF